MIPAPTSLLRCHDRVERAFPTQRKISVKVQRFFLRMNAIMFWAVCCLMQPMICNSLNDMFTE